MGRAARTRCQTNLTKNTDFSDIRTSFFIENFNNSSLTVGHMKGSLMSSPRENRNEFVAKSPSAEPQPGTAPHHIVGIGASAGGLEALEKFFQNMPSDTGMAFVVVQHLSPDYKSMMVELLSKHTPMKVLRAEDGMPVVSNHIYLIPPKKLMTISHGRLILTEKEDGSVIHLPIDIFLRSLAADQGDAAVAIILSGTGSDGMRGVRAVKEAGGMVMVQDEMSAKFNGMPRAAISTGVADYILPPQEMPAELVKFTSRKPGVPTERLPLNGPSTEPLADILLLLKNQTGVDFTYYKPNTVIRRLERRMHVNQIETLQDYFQYLIKSPREVNLLYKEMLIGVTNFFRDPEAFQFLKAKVIPEIVERRGPQDPIRVWCAGCSTGEEAYSLAMLFLEYHAEAGRPWDMKIFATDIDREALEYAGNGIYPESIAADVSPERLARFFTKSGGNYRVSRQMREMVIFAPHNVCKDPPFTRIDLISCRNLLIYLQPSMQKKVLAYFTFSLKPRGFLFLGASESVGDQAHYFTTYNQKWKIFRTRAEHRPVLGETLRMTEPMPRKAAGLFEPSKIHRVVESGELIERICTTLMERFATTCLVVDENFHLLYLLGDPSLFIRLSPGQVSLDVLQLMPKDLSMAASTALYRVKKEGKEVTYKGVTVRDLPAGPRRVHLRIVPERVRRQGNVLYLVFLEEETPNNQETIDATLVDPKDQAEQRIVDLEQELRYTRENLQATIEELETSNEELQATNEELLASNEELQSTNQELQSVNEELYTVNAEYQNKIAELTQLNNDLTNLLRCTDIGTLFLDREMKIRRFTPAATRFIHLMEQDLGRPLQHLAHSLDYPNMIDDVLFVVDTGETVVREVLYRKEIPVLVKIFPYLDEHGNCQGAVVTFVDVSDVKAIQKDLAKIEKEKDLILESVSDVILYLGKELKVLWANRASRDVFGLDASALVGLSREELWDSQGIHIDREMLLDVFKGAEPKSVEIAARDGARWLLRWVPIKNPSGAVRALVELATLIQEGTKR